MLRHGAVAGGSFFGVFWGATAAAYLYCRVGRRPFAPVADVLAAAAFLGLVPMRLGCLLNGCCYGRPTRLPWGIVFRDARSAVPQTLRGVTLHPSQVYEIIGASGIFLVLHFLALPRVRRGGLRPGAAFSLAVALYAAMRFCTDFLRGSDPGNISVAGLSTAQCIALAGLAGVMAVWMAQRRTPAGLR